MRSRACNPSNRAGTCVWCGKVLFYNAQLMNPRVPEVLACKRSEKGGAKEDDLFSMSVAVIYSGLSMRDPGCACTRKT